MELSKNFTFQKSTIQTFSDVNGETWFRGKDVCDVLDYGNSTRTIRDYVDEEDRSKLADLRGTYYVRQASKEDATVYINESGLYSLILRSNKPEAKAFKRWVTSELLPSLRRGDITQRLDLRNEADLHYKVVDFLRNHFPNAIIAPGLGELQDSSRKRLDSWSKGYTAGQPDLLICNANKKFNGFAIELKTPSGRGVVSEKQIEHLKSLSYAGWKTMISHDYDTIILELSNYMNEARIRCLCCTKVFKKPHTLERHLKAFHKL